MNLILVYQDPIMAKKKAVDPNRKKKKRMATDPVYRGKVLKKERERIASKRMDPGYAAKENAQRRKRYQERLDDPEEDFREKENRRYNEWYATKKAKKLKKKTGRGLDLLNDDIF